MRLVALKDVFVRVEYNPDRIRIYADTKLPTVPYHRDGYARVFQVKVDDALVFSNVVDDDNPYLTLEREYPEYFELVP